MRFAKWLWRSFVGQERPLNFLNYPESFEARLPPIYLSHDLKLSQISVILATLIAIRSVYIEYVAVLYPESIHRRPTHSDLRFSERRDFACRRRLLIFVTILIK